MNAETDPRMHELQELPGPSAGTQLRAAREARELSIADVAYALKLNPRQVDALEADRFDLLPGPAFARGFLKNYARFLELDPQPLLEAIDQAGAGSAIELAPVSNAQGTMPTADERFRPSVVPAAMVAFALMIVVAAGWYFDWFQQPTIVAEEPQPLPALQAAPKEQAAAVPDAAAAAEPPATTAAEPARMDGQAPAAPAGSVVASPAPASVGAPVVAPPEALTAKTDGGKLAEADARKAQPAASATANTPASTLQQPAPGEAEKVAVAPASGQHSLVFRFGEDAWVEVRDESGRVILSRIGKAGTAEEVQGRPPFSLVIGNAAKVVLEHDGRPVDLGPHTRVSVARLRLE